MEYLDLKNLPEEITVTMYPFYNSKYGWLSVAQHESPGSEYILIAEPVEITFKTSMRSDVMSQAVASLKQEQANIRAESERQCVALENKIQSLLALESA